MEKCDVFYQMQEYLPYTWTGKNWTFQLGKELLRVYN